MTGRSSRYEVLMTFTSSISLYSDFIITTRRTVREKPLCINIRCSITLNAITNLKISHRSKVPLSNITHTGPIIEFYEFTITATVCPIRIRFCIYLATLTSILAPSWPLDHSWAIVTYCTASRHMFIYIQCVISSQGKNVSVSILTKIPFLRFLGDSSVVRHTWNG